MSNNTKIFSEAIAEAKAIRETAMANAKLALEEAFAPRIQEMMSTKLEALAEEDVDDDDYQVANDAAMDAVNAVSEEISLEELLAELEGLEEGEKEEVEEGYREGVYDDFNKWKSSFPEGTEFEQKNNYMLAKSSDGEELGKWNPISQQGMHADDFQYKNLEEKAIAEVEVKDEEGSISVDELKDIIRDIMSDIMGGGAEEEAGEEEVEDSEEMSSEDDLELEEILAEISSLEEGDLEENLRDTIKGAAQKVGGSIQKGLGNFEKWIDKSNQGMEDWSKKKGIYQKSDAVTQKAIDAKQKALGKAPLGKGFGLVEADELDEALGQDIKALAAKYGESFEKWIDSVGKKLHGGEGWGLNKENVQEEELQEAMSTIATLRSELNEVNLLNAKLLYVNKLFKAKNLNEAQKVKVINAFDRAETVREAKNVFDTLNESLNTEKAKSQIKESLSFASKASGVSDRQPIMEGNDFVNRMQKLAGII